MISEEKGINETKIEDFVSEKKENNFINYLSATLEERIIDTILKIELLNTEVNEIKKMVVQFNEKLQDYKVQLAKENLKQTQLDRNLTTLRGTYNVLSQKAEETRIAAATKPGLLKIVKEAYTPKFPISPRKKRNVLLSGIIGLMFGVFLAFLIEYFKSEENQI